MTERYDIAAIRHLKSAECLEAGGHLDDAGYHLGVCAENAVKSAMREAGLENHWAAQGPKVLRASPMKGHWSKLHDKIVAASAEINLHASGRRAAPLLALTGLGAAGKFSDWSIDIRYADPDHVPIDALKYARWKSDAEDFLIRFVMV